MRLARSLIMVVALGFVSSAPVSGAEPRRPVRIFEPVVRQADPRLRRSGASLTGIVLGAIRARLDRMGEAVLVEDHPSRKDRPCLEQPTHECLLASDIPKDASVLLGEVNQTGERSYELTLRLWQLLPSGSLAESPVAVSSSCNKCSDDEVTEAVKDLAGSLMDRGSASEASAIAPRPPSEQCSAPKLCLLPGTGTASGIDPRLASTLQGITWGGFALSVVATIALFAVNNTGAGAIETGGYRVDHVLTPASWTAAGLTVLTLGIAIPTTILTNRAKLRKPASASAASAP